MLTGASGVQKSSKGHRTRENKTQSRQTAREEIAVLTACSPRSAPVGPLAVEAEVYDPPPIARPDFDTALLSTLEVDGTRSLIQRSVSSMSCVRAKEVEAV